jgi:hypothetical protein
MDPAMVVTANYWHKFYLHGDWSKKHVKILHSAQVKYTAGNIRQEKAVQSKFSTSPL